VGKTEVLMRAAVAVASAGYKAVIVVPTRVLVDQYMAAYSERIQSCGPYYLTILLALGHIGGDSQPFEKTAL